MKEKVMPLSEVEDEAFSDRTCHWYYCESGAEITIHVDNLIQILFGLRVFCG